jgi:hypothetical protein
MEMIPRTEAVGGGLLLPRAAAADDADGCVCTPSLPQPATPRNPRGKTMTDTRQRRDRRKHSQVAPEVVS